jgi:hypothetical protein
MFCVSFWYVVFYSLVCFLEQGGKQKIFNYETITRLIISRKPCISINRL